MNIEENMVYRGVTLRVRPGSKNKHDKMMRIGGACRKAWNEVLEICEKRWQDYKAGKGDKPLVTFFYLCKLYVQVKQELPWNGRYTRDSGADQPFGHRQEGLGNSKELLVIADKSTDAPHINPGQIVHCDDEVCLLTVTDVGAHVHGHRIWRHGYSVRLADSLILQLQTGLPVMATAFPAPRPKGNKMVWSKKQGRMRFGRFPCISLCRQHPSRHTRLSDVCLHVNWRTVPNPMMVTL